MTSKLRLFVVAATAVALSTVAVAPATAQPNNGGSSGRQSCTGPDGEQYTHGSTYVSYIRLNGKLHTAYVYKCNNGKWEKVPGRVAQSQSGAQQATAEASLLR